MRTPPNDGVHIRAIIEGTSCEKHHAERNVACWDIYVGAISDWAPAICGARVRKAGFVGTISPTSMSQGSVSRSTAGRPKTYSKRN